MSTLKPEQLSDFVRMCPEPVRLSKGEIGQNGLSGGGSAERSRTRAKTGADKTGQARRARRITKIRRLPRSSCPQMSGFVPNLSNRQTDVRPGQRTYPYRYVRCPAADARRGREAAPDRTGQLEKPVCP